MVTLLLLVIQLTMLKDTFKWGFFFKNKRIINVQQYIHTEFIYTYTKTYISTFIHAYVEMYALEYVLLK